MIEIFIVLGLFACVVWLISHAVLMVVRVKRPDDVPSKHFDPITTYVLDNYGQHFQDDSGSALEHLRKL